jgi:uncharacterized membrane protein YheB (UPF0754 family)
VLIKDLFRDSVERYINPVIKVQVDDIGVANKNLQEYVITDQLRGHFENVYKYLNDKNKVWILDFRMVRVR